MIKFIRKLFAKKKPVTKKKPGDPGQILTYSRDGTFKWVDQENSSTSGSHTSRVIRGYVSVNHLGEPILENLNSMCFTAEDYLHHCTTTIGANEAIDKAWEDMKEVSTVGYEELRERTLAEKECSQCTTVGLKHD